jgi:hypothetical protein
MEHFKRMVRITILSIMLALALSGIGIGGVMAHQKEKYIDREVRIEMVEKKKEDTEDETESAQEVKD